MRTLCVLGTSGSCLPIDTRSHPRRTDSSAAPLWKPQNPETRSSYWSYTSFVKVKVKAFWTSSSTSCRYRPCSWRDVLALTPYGGQGTLFCLPRTKSCLHPLVRRLGMVTNEEKSICHFREANSALHFRSLLSAVICRCRQGGERRCTSNPFVTRQWVTSTTLLSLYPREWPGTRCKGVWVGLEPDLGGTENITPPRFDPRTVQPAAIRYTDYAIPVTFGILFSFVCLVEPLVDI